jgi:hypothetical protein
MFDAGRARLIDDMLDDRPINHRQHFFGHGLCRRQEARTEARDRKYGLADRSGCRQGSTPRSLDIGSPGIELGWPVVGLAENDVSS